MIRYKLTGSDGTTRGDMLWEPGRTNRTKGKGRTLCSDGVIHVYETALQAAYMWPAHVPTYTRLWEVEVPAIVADDGTHQGVREATAIREIPLPEIEVAARVEIAIRVALRVYYDPSYVAWGEQWLRRKDRSEDSARTAMTQAAETARAADVAAAAQRDAAAWTQWTAAWAAARAAWAAAAAAAWAASAAVWTIECLSYTEQGAQAAQAATSWAAGAAAWAAVPALAPICLSYIINEVMRKGETNE